jgi:hypothetical protein
MAAQSPQAANPAPSTEGPKSLELEDARYDPSIYTTPFAQLPNAKRVWLGSPGSALEGLGMCPPPY